MAEIFTGRWNNMDPKYYLNQLRWSAGVGWLGNMPMVHGVSQLNVSLTDDYLVDYFAKKGLKTVSFHITNAEDWEEFARSAYVPSYKDGKDYTSPDAVPLKLKEFAKEREMNPDYIRKKSTMTGLAEFDSVAILTGYDPVGCKRLIADGGHRAVIINNEIGTRVPNAIIYECVGEAIDTFFNSDFPHLKRMAHAEKEGREQKVQQTPKTAAQP